MRDGLILQKLSKGVTYAQPEHHTLNGPPCAVLRAWIPVLRGCGRRGCVRGVAGRWAVLSVCVAVTLCGVDARIEPRGAGGARGSAGFRGSRAGSGRVGRALWGVVPAGGLGPVGRARWVLVGHLGDMVDVASASGDSVAVSRLSLAVLRVLASIEGRAPRVAGEDEGVTSSDDNGSDRPLSVDEQYERLCAELGDPAES